MNLVLVKLLVYLINLERRLNNMTKQDYIDLSCPKATIRFDRDKKEHTLLLGEFYEITHYNSFNNCEEVIFGYVVGFILDGHIRKVVVSTDIGMIGIYLYDISYFKVLFKNVSV